jgi:enamine deaminase RidA (YjgF/YER057c/UK114 family)
MTIEERLEELGLVLPAPIQPPPGVVFPFAPVHVVGKRVLISGHSATNSDGSIAGPFGKVGADVSIEQAQDAARRTGLAILASLKLKLGDLDRIGRWVKAFGMVNSAPGFTKQVAVMNGFSTLILEVYGPERGLTARSAVGMAELPFGIPVEVEAEAELA